MIACKMMCSNNTDQQREITNASKGSRVCDMANIVISNLNILNLEPRSSTHYFGRLSHSERYVSNSLFAHVASRKHDNASELDGERSDGESNRPM
jgi:hypothetical protein